MEKELKKIKDEVLACQKCSLSQERRQDNLYPVIGQGDHQAKIMFIGEAPGSREAKEGRPFCGRAGKMLDEFLESVNIKREKVYITNLLKCRPTNNRDPLPEEIKTCTFYLKRQVKIIKPEIICPLGRYSTFFLMEEFGLGDKIKGIGQIHGKLFKTENFIIIPFYHPAAALYKQSMKEVIKEDFKNLSREIKKNN